jgi:hypothetical protein
MSEDLAQTHQGRRNEDRPPESTVCSTQRYHAKSGVSARNKSQINQAPTCSSVFMAVEYTNGSPI